MSEYGEVLTEKDDTCWCDEDCGSEHVGCTDECPEDCMADHQGEQ